MFPGSHYFRHQTKYVFIAVDPSGGGTSAFSIAAMHYTADNEFAVGCSPVQKRSPAHMRSITSTSMQNSTGCAPPWRTYVVAVSGSTRSTGARARGARR